MSTTIQALGLDRLGMDERLQLVQDLWDSIAADVEQSSLSDAERREVDRRWAAHQANPAAAIPWEQVEAEALARLQG